MAQQFSPELYLSLLSSRDGNLSKEHRKNAVGSRRSNHPLSKHPDQLLDVLDALAAICVHNAKGDVFFVSLAIEPNSTTLYVSTDGTVPATLPTHLRKIRDQLKQLKSVVEPGAPNLADIECPDPNNTQLRKDGELELQRTIYEYSYKNVEQCFNKRGPAILDRYSDIMEGLEANNAAEHTKILTLTRVVLVRVEDILVDEKLTGLLLTTMIKMIASMNKGWHKRLEDVGDESVLTRWDDLTRKSGLASCIHDTIHCSSLILVVKQDRNLSLRRFLRKLFTLHHYIQSILRIALSSRLSPFLEGQFDVVSVPAVPSDISIQISHQKVLPIAFLPENKATQDVRKTVYDQLTTYSIANESGQRGI